MLKIVNNLVKHIYNFCPPSTFDLKQQMELVNRNQELTGLLTVVM